MTEDADETVQAEDEDSEVATPFKYSITAYGADYPVDGLVKRVDSGDIFIPSFQRGYVWSLTRASRFVESLLLGLPVPGIFLSKDEPSQKLLVIDGQQRLRTLQFFYQGLFGPTEKKFSLQGVQSRFLDATYRSLLDEDRRRLDDSILHATIVRQDEPSEDQSSIYYLFERLNTGGVALQPQEIRACIYHGPFSDLLKTLNQTRAWRAIYGKESLRMRDQELILRFLALFFDSGHYERPMTAFLNSYMGTNRQLRRQAESELRAVFVPTIEVIAETIGGRAFRPRRALNAAVFDAVMVGVAQRLTRASIGERGDIVAGYERLLADEKFVNATEKSTTDAESVKTRLSLSIETFSRVR
jgi:Protein of unknown function DUF262